MLLAFVACFSKQACSAPSKNRCDRIPAPSAWPESGQLSDAKVPCDVASGWVAWLVEQRIESACVGGSIPLRNTKNSVE